MIKSSIPKLDIPEVDKAIRGVNERTSVNSFTGSLSFSIPLETSSSRDLSPTLDLNYNSGNGNGLFGCGFSVNELCISRLTRRGTPRYDLEDIFTFNGDELVLKEGEDSVYLERHQQNFPYIKQNNIGNKECYWKTINADNVISLYGNTDGSRVYDPNNESKIFKWFLTEVEDSKGNKVKYNYEKFGCTNAYLRSIQYGNYIKDNIELFAFEIIFDYGNHQMRSLSAPNADPYTPVGNPPLRSDIIHSFCSGFHIKTEYLCRNILIFHKLSELSEQPYLTKYFHFKYDENPSVSMLLSFQETGCILKEDKSYSTQSIPKTDFTFSKFTPVENPDYMQPEVKDSKEIQFQLDLVDFAREGVNGILYRRGESLLYYSPSGEGEFNQNLPPVELPTGYSDATTNMYLKSVNGDGTLQLVSESANENGYYTLDNYNQWNDYVPFESNYRNTISGYLEEADVSGKGLSDKIILEPDQIQYIPSLGYKGYNQPVIIKEDKDIVYPGSLVNNDPYTIHVFADMFGDGLSHRVKISSGEVKVWPTLGYGYFDTPLTITKAPVFDRCIDLRRRVLLTDIDGSGTTDIVVLFQSHILIYINQSGNSFSDPIQINLPKEIDYSDADQIQFADITGNGNLCLIFTKTGLPVKHYYYELGDTKIIRGKTCKPFLLCKTDNNLGAKSTIEYTSSVKYYLNDKKNNKPWYSKLPFPVQVVSKTITEDYFSNNSLSSEYSYRNGYYDSFERAFTGFGYVEHKDRSLVSSNNQENLPVAITKQWFHLGNGMNDEKVREEFFKGDDKAPEIPFAVFDFDFEKATLPGKQQALYTLAGKEIHTEIYEENVNIPYSVSQQCFLVKNSQKVIDKSRFGVFSAFSIESIALDYEQNAFDPSLKQDVILETDEFNHPLLTAAIYYPRRNPLIPEQANFYSTAHKAVLKNQDDPAVRWIGVPMEGLSFEITGLAIQGGEKYINYSTLKQNISDSVSHYIPYSDQPNPEGICARILSRVKYFYWNADQTSYIPDAGKEPLPSVLISHHSKNIEFDNTIIAEAYNKEKNRIADEDLIKQGFLYEDAYWWNRTQVSHYEKGNFYLLKQVSNDWALSNYVDPTLYTENIVLYDQYYLIPVRTSEKLSKDLSIVTEVKEIDYRLLLPKKIADINNNISEVLFDELGRVIVSSYYGKVNGVQEGFLPLDDYHYKKPDNIGLILDNKTELEYLQKAQSFSYYEFASKNTDGHWSPSCIVTLNATEYQLSDIQKIEKAVSYSDGFGRLIETKQWAGKITLIDGTDTDNGWLTSGRIIYNCKALAWKSYLPFFSKDYQFESNWDREIQPFLPNPTIYTYDALDRVVRTDTPKGFFTKTVYGVWGETEYDEDDTVLDSEYYKEFMKAHTSGDEYDALKQAEKFYNTPVRILFDPMERSVITLQDNLGRIRPDSFDKIASAEITSQAIYNNLEKNGYLVFAEDSMGGAWITDKFTPYIKNFVLHLDEPVAKLAVETQLILEQARLAAWQKFDISGRILCNADPRFFSENLKAQNAIYNFIHHFSIVGEVPLLTQSVDAGNSSAFANMLGNPVKSWDARNIVSSITYDSLQRPLHLRVETPEGYTPVINQIVQRNEYGELHGGAEKQMMGKVYKVYDSAGIVITPEYNIIGIPENEIRQFRVDYKNEANWDTITNEKLEEALYRTEYNYDALGRVLNEKQPDNTNLIWRYGPLGNCIKSFVNKEGKELQEIVTESSLDANGQPLQVRYSNTVRTKYTYDKDTLELLQINSTRYSGNDCFQQLFYTHDPVGLITTMRNTIQETVHHNNQEINPRTQYYYDPIYRVTEAQGRFLKGVHSTLQLKSKNLFHRNNLQEVELYTEKYQYDKGSNLKKLQRIGSYAYTRNFKISDATNHLIESNDNTIQYNNEGQMLNLPSGIKLQWNYAGNIAKATIIERESREPDAEYYVYDYARMRVRKVKESLVSGSTLSITDKRYCGNYTTSLSGTKLSTGKVEVNKEFRSITIGGFNKHDCLLQYWAIHKDKPLNVPYYRFQHADVINSVTIETNLQADIISLEEYSPFGETTYTWSDTNLEISPKEYRYSAKEKDDATGLYYYGYRYYMPELCRWTRPDPAGTIDGLNVYAFVENDPVSTSDYKGLTVPSNLHASITQPHEDEIMAMNHADLSAYTRLLGKSLSIGSSHTKKLDSYLTTIGYTHTAVTMNNEPGITAAISLADQGKKIEFKKAWRDLVQNSDEHFSCESAYSIFEGMKNGGQTINDQIIKLFKVISHFRSLTAETGYNVGNDRFQHPTNYSQAFHDNHATEHGHFDLERRRLTLLSGLRHHQKQPNDHLGTIMEMLGAASRYTINRTAPAIASDATIINLKTSLGKRSQAMHREKMKKQLKKLRLAKKTNKKQASTGKFKKNNGQSIRNQALTRHKGRALSEERKGL